MGQSDGSGDASSSRTLAGLTVREYLVLAASAAGLDVREIAAELRDSSEAVRSSLTSVIEKLGAGSKLEAVIVALMSGLIALPPTTEGGDGLGAAPPVSKRDVVALIAEGLTDDEIAARLGLSPAVVAGLAEEVLRRLRLGSRDRPMAWAFEQACCGEGDDVT
jgi:DNA-binding NarL/FixJ family response regulator